MDPAAISAVLLAVAGGAGGTLGGQLWAGLVSLVRRPSRPEKPSGDTTGGTTGEAGLIALRAAPADRDLAMRLAEALLARADADPGFRQALEGWCALAEPMLAGGGQVTNTISGGTQHGPVLQGRDFGSVTFGTPGHGHTQK